MERRMIPQPLEFFRGKDPIAGVRVFFKQLLDGLEALEGVPVVLAVPIS